MVNGRPPSLGGSQANAMIWQICSGSNVGGEGLNHGSRTSSLRTPSG
jgi:hypothetical protein